VFFKKKYIPLLNSTLFFYLAFDETETSNIQNRVVGILLGGAVPTDLVGTTDTNFYDHYSQLATVEANWDLPTLGRYDVGANVFAFVAEQTGDTIRSLTSPLLSLSQTLLDSSYPGIFNSEKTAPIPIPKTSLVVNGRAVLPQIVETWGSAALQACAVYNGSLGVPSAKNPPVLPKGCS
jgi:acid phosphatase